MWLYTAFWVNGGGFVCLVCSHFGDVWWTFGKRHSVVWMLTMAWLKTSVLSSFWAILLFVAARCAEHGDKGHQRNTSMWTLQEKWTLHLYVSHSGTAVLETFVSQPRECFAKAYGGRKEVACCWKLHVVVGNGAMNIALMTCWKQQLKTQQTVNAEKTQETNPAVTRLEIWHLQFEEPHNIQH